MTAATVGLKTFIFCPPPLGTPDPNQLPDFENKKPRPRVFLPAQEPHTNTCTFAAADRIRLVMGNHPSVSQHPLRKRELAVSKIREAYIQLDKETYWKKDFVNESVATIGRKINKEVAVGFIQSNEKKDLERPEILTLFREFVGQKKITDLHEFVMHEYFTRLKEVVKLFCREIANDQGEAKAEEILGKVQNVLEQAPLSFEKTVSRIKAIISRVILIDFVGLKMSTWHPSQPVSSLIQEIDENGPLKVTGQFGMEFYEEKPFHLTDMEETLKDKVQGRSLWGWSLGAKRMLKLMGDFHVIVIVGARSGMIGAKKIEHVYFIDPLDPSDPKKPESQKIYVMSFEKFRDGICDINCRQLRDQETGENVFFEPAKEGMPNEYALHGDPKTNYL